MHWIHGKFTPKSNWLKPHKKGFIVSNYFAIFFGFRMSPGMMIVKNNSNVSNWDLQNGYSNDRFHGEYPKRIYHAGENSGMTLELSLYKEDLDSEYVCRQLSVGFTIALSVPGEQLTFSHEFVRIPLLEEVWIRIKSKLTTTSEGLRSYSPNQRKCYYEVERQLRFFRNYTQKNCEAECLANFTNQQCGCVRFFMPSKRQRMKQFCAEFLSKLYSINYLIFPDFSFGFTGSASTPICGGVKIECCESVTKTFFEFSETVDQSPLDKCNCLPACTSIEYNTEVGHSKFDWDILQKTISDKEVKYYWMFLQNIRIWKWNQCSISDNGRPECTFSLAIIKSSEWSEWKSTHTSTFWQIVAVCSAYFWVFLH